MTKPPPSASDADRLADPSASQTNWSVIYQAAHGQTGPARVAWEQLVRRYWPAIYAFVRHRGADVHEAADLTQGFVCDVMIARHLLATADPTRGRFRTLLLASLKNYLADRHRHQSRQKRAPTNADGELGHRFSIDTAELRETALASYDSPDAAFTAQWSTALVRRVLDDVRAACETEGLRAHWAVFEARIARPMLAGEIPVPYPILVDRFQLKDAAQAANMMITVKRRFAQALGLAVSETVSDPDDIADELGELIRSLERPR
ncbi:MAG: sigma-70 family RNA polymerase sigma factor [Phycisphaerales bacterium]|nr:sigma-70 family RNA polymerase sigma factor [Phycisphaerales bacterium]NNM24890.1 sigma-70 family RNA polymerase sigma factor [Phycisphaerales bacterium]